MITQPIPPDIYAIERGEYDDAMLLGYTQSEVDAMAWCERYNINRSESEKAYFTQIPHISIVDF